jgi:hypothetical protein
VEKAQLESAAIRLERSSTLKKVFNTGGVVSCDVCLDCGAISNLRGDPKLLAEMIS